MRVKFLIYKTKIELFIPNFVCLQLTNKFNIAIIDKKIQKF